MRARFLCGAAVAAISLSMAGQALSQPAPATTSGSTAEVNDNTTEVQEVVVTGSLIRGTPETAALPVDVVTSEELAKQGMPSTVEIIKALPVSNGVIGETNQFTAGRGQGAEGVATVNLRGLGPERTLVLFNGRRLATIGNVVDANIIPQAAVGRVEVLKDGAAATYGSDAIGGVVNFITKKNLSGLEVGADYRWVKGSSSGDYSGSLAWGWRGENANILLSLSAQHRGYVPLVKRDWAIRPFIENPEGGWTRASNPGNFIPVTGSPAIPNSIVPVAAQRADPGCTQLGGVLTNPAAVPGGFANCNEQYTPFDNLVSKQDRYQAYGELNFDLTSSTQFHAEALYAYTRANDVTTPSYATTRPITRTVLPTGIPNGGTTGFNVAAEPDALNFFYVPSTNPGFQALLAQNPTFLAGPAPVTGAFITIGQYRPFLAGGNPGLDNRMGHSDQFYNSRAFRIVADLKGELTDLPLIGKPSWDVSFDYSSYRRYTAGYDTVTGRLALALRGLGGPSCDYLTGTPGVGNCSYLNPFSTGVAGDARTGIANPGFVASTANTPELARWIFPFQEGYTTRSIAVWDAVLSGQSTVKLPGGAIGWAVGAQYKTEYLKNDPRGFANAELYPCPDTPINGNSNCFPSPTSPTVFLGTARPLDLNRPNYAVYGELELPITDKINAQLAARYEDYGEQGGDTFNPQLRAKWQVTDAFALRGSIGTTFRAPPPEFLIPDSGTTLQNVLGAFLPVEVRGNEALEPEKATVWSLGAIVQQGGLKVTADYWHFDFTDIITTEGTAPVVNSLFPNGATGPNNCGTLTPEYIASHFEFSGACAGTAVIKVKTLRINGPKIETSGVDLIVDYRMENVLGGDAGLGGSLTWIERYQVDPLVVGGVVAAPGYDAVGRFNAGQALSYPLPQWKAQLYQEYTRGPHNLRLTTRFVASYADDRGTLFGFNANYQTLPNAQCPFGSLTPGCGIVLNGTKIKSQALMDVTYRMLLPRDITVTATVTNIFDRDPPFARTELNYDPLTGDPLGRTYKLSLSKVF